MHNSSPHSDKSTCKTKLGHERKHIPSVSSALVIGGILGILQALILVFGAIPILNFMGVKPVSIFSMHIEEFYLSSFFSDVFTLLVMPAARASL